MKLFVRNAIARIDVMRRNETLSRGTACLVGEGLVLTALHVIADRYMTPPRFIEGRITLTFPEFSTRGIVLEPHWNPEEDWVLLACETPPTSPPLRLASIASDGLRWQTYGFPDAQPDEGMACGGTIENHAGVLDGVPAHQLFCRQAAAGHGMPVRGLSGAPLIVDDAVAGILRWALLSDGDNVGGTIYACPAALIARANPAHFSGPLKELSSSAPPAGSPVRTLRRDMAALEQLTALETGMTDQAFRGVVRALRECIAGSSIGSATPRAIGRSIRRVIRQCDLAPAAAAALLQYRLILGSPSVVDPHYPLGAVIDEKSSDFVGRHYVFDAIDRFLQAVPCGYFIIEGDPGIGKSAMLAEFTRRTGCIAHFNVRSLGINTTAQFIQSVCAQVIADAGLPYEQLPSGGTTDGAFLLRTMAEAAQALAPEPLVIAIDALDEVDLSAQPSGSNILLLPATLPRGVYVVMTRRQVDVPLVTLSPQRLLDMTAHRAENRADVEASLTRAVKRPQLRAWIEARVLTASAFITQLADLSDNNFMYLRYVLPEIEDGAYTTLSIDRLPAGLGGYYDDHWRLMGMTTKPLPRPNIRILYILCEVRQPVSRTLISQFASDASMHVDELTVQETLDTWRQFLTEEAGAQPSTYSIYHASFRDFLRRKDIVQAAGVTLRDINALIADNLWNGLFGANAP